MRNEVNLSELIVENERYVECVAKQYLNQGLTLEQLIEEGNKGLDKRLNATIPARAMPS